MTSPGSFAHAAARLDCLVQPSLPDTVGRDDWYLCPISGPIVQHVAGSRGDIRWRQPGQFTQATLRRLLENAVRHAQHSNWYGLTEFLQDFEDA